MPCCTVGCYFTHILYGCISTVVANMLSEDLTLPTVHSTAARAFRWFCWILHNHSLCFGFVFAALFLIRKMLNLFIVHLNSRCAAAVVRVCGIWGTTRVCFVCACICMQHKRERLPWRRIQIMVYANQTHSDNSGMLPIPGVLAADAECQEY